ncbi:MULTISPECIES: M23 family metallopeptidase [Rickettsieae]|jgi:Peptidase family M23|uniref:M23 family metallopeptidase n=1 Tax=Rickettsieae TaxID=33988 RepID=UPI000B9C3C68|nr:M23 family metallopeptidase [Rickettsia endosymbiont of Culicoides newsteadi]OZG32054.1 hypothetical protein RiCNE_05300 [Rickettsia endosymbiont of Culicoides newsteadi]
MKKPAYLIALHLMFITVSLVASANDAIYISCPQGYIPSIPRDQDLKQGARFKCEKTPLLAKMKLAFPFQKNHKIKCIQGSLQMGRSHSHDAIKFALDFASLPDSSDGTVVASEDGIAYIYDKCNNPHYSNITLDDCGSGYGNHVRIVHQGIYISLYGHLSKILVKNGQVVKKYEPIGIEGMSGNAGVRHLHFSVHKPYEDINQIIANPGWTGKSIPFVFEEIKYLKTPKTLNVSSTDVICDNNDINWNDNIIMNE